MLVLLALVVAAVGGVLVANGGGSPARHHVASPRARTVARPIVAAGSRIAVHRHGLAAEISAGRAEIAQLARLQLPLYCGGPRGHEVAFTFDDGPGPYTYLALRKLAQAHERATFFVVGRSIENYPGWLPKELRVAALGDHTYTHPDLIFLSATQIYSEIEEDAALIRTQTGDRVDLFRPPYEAHNATVDGIARRLGMLEVLWSIDSQDSLGYDYAQIIQTVEAGLKPGSIILFHENHGQTIRALTTLLPYLHRRHLRSVSIPELMATDPPSVAQLRRGWSGCGERVQQVGSGS